MSKKYQEAMDQIVVSEELKEKILKEAAKKNTVSEKKHSRMFYLRYAAGFAACLAICLTASKFVTVLPSNDPTPVFPQTPVQETKTPETVPPAKSAAPQQTPASETAKPKKTAVPQKTETPKENEVPKETETSQKTAAPAKTEIPVKTETPVTAEIPTVSPLPSETDEPLEEGVMSGNPIEAATLEEIRTEVGYPFKLPQYLPDGYRPEEYSLLFGSLIQASYVSETDEILYRTEKTDLDISGDYNRYETEETAQINGMTVTVKGQDNRFYTATWQSEDQSYSVSSRNGISREEFIKIVESVQ